MAKIVHYDIGDLWTPTMTWKVGTTPTDPSQIVVRLKEPSGTLSVVTTAAAPSTLTSASTPLARLSQGVFQMLPGVTLDAAGYWFLRAEGTGAAEASEDFQAVVDPSEFYVDGGLSSRALVGLAETKDWLNQQNIDTGEDLEIVRVINDISERLHDEADREFTPKDSNPTRSFDVEYCGRSVYVGDLASLTTASPAVIVQDWVGTTLSTFDATDVTTYPLNRQAWEPIRKLELTPLKGTWLRPGLRVQVTGSWGFPAIPGNLRQAALDAIAAVLDRDVEHYRQDLGAATAGGETVVLAPQPVFVSLPPGVMAVVQSFRNRFIG